MFNLCLFIDLVNQTLLQHFPRPLPHLQLLNLLQLLFQIFPLLRNIKRALILSKTTINNLLLTPILPHINFLPILPQIRRFFLLSAFRLNMHPIILIILSHFFNFRLLNLLFRQKTVLILRRRRVKRLHRTRRFRYMNIIRVFFNLFLDNSL